jgi:hypothetical protein
VKLEYKSATGPARRHLDRAASLRKTDQLLQYLKQARHADEHSLQSSTFFAIPLEVTLPPRSAFIWNLSKGTVSAEGGDVALQVGKLQYHLLAITNREATFQPPTIHLGNPVVDRPPRVLQNWGCYSTSDCSKIVRGVSNPVRRERCHSHGPISQSGALHPTLDTKLLFKILDSVKCALELMAVDNLAA